jgi:xanthine/CO dehydrogenase XdhC/CoxF family maturation factor
LLCGNGVHWNGIDDPALRERIVDIGSRATDARPAHVERMQAAPGMIDALFERVRPAHRLVIIGANPGALALAQQSRLLGWEAIIIDQAPWPPAAGEQDAAFAQMAPSELAANMAFDRFTFVVAMTHNLDQDMAWLRVLVDVPLRYVGVIGSRQRAARLRQALPELGTRLHTPAGLDIGSETPAEIALAVAAEVLTVANQRAGKSLTTAAEPIHA